MATIEYDTLLHIAHRAGLLHFHDAESVIDPAYSGRGMYGRTCVGFIVADPDERNRLAVALDGHDEFSDAPVRTDGMGLRTIVYYPSIRCDDHPQ